MAGDGFELYATGVPFPEGPVFDTGGGLFVCARRDGYIVRIDPERAVHRFVETDGKPNGLAIDGEDRLYVADSVRGEILTVDPDGALRVLIPRHSGALSLVGPNDLCFGRSGALYFTDPGMSMAARDGAVYRYRADDGLTPLSEGMAFPNGLAVTKDESTLYVVDSTTSHLVSIDLTASLPRSADPVMALGDGAGPDGMAWIDAERLLIALHYAGTLGVVNLTDRSLRTVPVAAESHPTNIVIKHGVAYVTVDIERGVLTRDVASL